MHRILKNIREIRKEKNYSQQEIAERIGSTQPAYGRFENGKTKTDFITLEKVAEILEVDMWTIHYYHDPEMLFKNPELATSIEALSHRIEALVRLIQQSILMVESLQKQIDAEDSE